MTAFAYYNENNPCAAQWLRNLIEAGAIAPGVVDDRSIVDVQPEELTEFRQVHLFAGFGGWSYALRLAGWPDDRPAWTGSAPCPPFSIAGRKKCCPGCGSTELFPHPFQTGIFICTTCDYEWMEDGRHLYPEMLRLLAERRPPIVFGEQVAGPDGLKWISGVRVTLEILGYALGTSDLPAASVSSPQKRQRFYWGAVRLGDSQRSGLEGHSRTGDVRNESGRELPGQVGGFASPTGIPTAPWMGDVYGLGCERHDNKPGELQPSTGHAPAQGVAHSNRDSTGARNEGAAEGPGESPRRNAGERGFWSDYELVPFPGGECRRVEPGTYPLDHGLPPRVGRDCTGTEGFSKISRKAFIEGMGNAIVPQLAAEFVKAFMEAI